VGESDEHQCDRAEDAQCPLFDLSRPPDQDSLFDRSVIDAAPRIFNASIS
jgi:hypothetical protein